MRVTRVVLAANKHARCPRRPAHVFCHGRQLSDLLSKLSLEPEGAPFLVPVNWQELGLNDYPEIVETPMDLHTISKRLNMGHYDDVDGLIDPELMFKDVALCWDNCMKYFENDAEVEAVQMALAMSSAAAILEGEFWADLLAFEESLEKSPFKARLAIAAAIMGDNVKKVAKRSRRKTTVLANDMVKYAADWWQGSRHESPFWSSHHRDHLIGRAWPSRFKRAIAVVRETVRRVPLPLDKSYMALAAI